MPSFLSTLDPFRKLSDSQPHSHSNSQFPTHGTGISGLVLRHPFVPTAAIALALVSMLATIIVGWFTLRSMRELTGQTLRSVLTANVTAMEMWLSEQKQEAFRAAEPESVQSAAAYLIAKSEDDFQWDTSDLMVEPAFGKLQEELTNEKFMGWCLMAPDHVVIASDLDDFVGKTLAIPDSVNQRVLQLQTAICPPMVSPAAIEPDGPLSIPGGPIMGAMAPIRTGNKAIGALVLLMNPMGRFTELLSVARSGKSDETYAFDAQARMLTQSRFDDQLRNAGLLPGDTRVPSMLHIEIRDPGVDLTTGTPPAVSIAEQPLTLMADQATRGGKGENLMGYNDYRGILVVGAWTWLPEYDMGITTEIDVAEAYRPVSFLRRSVLTLMTLLGISTMGLVLLAGGYRRLTNRVGIAQPIVQRLGRYERGELLGRGGMGSVYRGTHELLRRPVAIKVLGGDDLHGENLSSQAIARFEREVQLTASLRHPNTIEVYDYGRTDDGTFFYVMEYVDGITLQHLVDKYGAQSPARVIHLMLQIGGSLGEAHRQDLIHRDVKPANVLLFSEIGLPDWIKVLDFGLIKSIASAPTDVTLTQTDTITGTPMYMSPECVRDAAVANEQSDLYSLGAVGYALLTGKPIFEGSGSVDICMKQLSEVPVRPSERLGTPLPEDLQNVLMSCLRKDPTERPRNMEDLASALRSCDDAGQWNEVDTIEWWEQVFPGSSPIDSPPSDSHQHFAQQQNPQREPV